MLYFLLIMALLVTAFLVTRLRARLLLSPERKLLFVGLGRTGPEFDFVERVIRIRLCGLKIRQLAMRRADEAAISVGGEYAARPPRPRRAEPLKPKEKRSRPLGMLLEIVFGSARALLQYVVALFKGIIVEEASGELTFGFDSPDVTGKVYGYYHALAWAAPDLTNKVNVVPSFSGKTASGLVQVTIALPMYVLVYRTGRLIMQLPIRKIVKYSRGISKGVSHGEQ